MSNQSLEAFIAVSGNRAGTGASSLSRSLAEFFSLHRYSAPRRVIALGFLQEIVANPHEAEEKLFDKLKNNLLNNSDYIDQLMGFNRDLPIDETELARFNQAADDYDQDYNLELAVDGWLIKKLNELNGHGLGGVFDAKLAVLLDKIRCKNCSDLGVWPDIINSCPSLSVPLIRVVLTVSEEESVRRILKREQRECDEQKQEALSEEEIEEKTAEIAQLSNERIAADWQRYSRNYTHTDRDTPLTPVQLTDEGLENLIIIDTTNKTPLQVEVEALEKIAITLSVIGGFERWTEKISAQIEKLKQHHSTNPV